MGFVRDKVLILSRSCPCVSVAKPVFLGFRFAQPSHDFLRVYQRLNGYKLQAAADEVKIFMIVRHQHGDDCMQKDHFEILLEDISSK